MTSLSYVAVLAACVLITLPLEWLFRARVYRRPVRLLRTLAPVIAVFVVWDLIGAARGHWWWDPRYLTGAELLGLPAEEWLFFLVVPVCALLTFEALGHRPRRAAGAGRTREPSGQAAARPDGRPGVKASRPVPVPGPVPGSTGGRRGR